MISEFLLKKRAGRLIILLCYGDFARKKHWIYLQINATMVLLPAAPLQRH